MRGGLLRHGGRRAAELLLRSSRSPLSSHQPPPRPPPRAYVRSSFLTTKFKGPSSVPSAAASTTTAAAAAAAAATAATAAAGTATAAAAARSGFVGWYLGMIEARPVLTKSLTAGTIFTVADLTSQMITLAPSESLEFIRTARMAGYGMAISGPTLHLWYNYVSRILPKQDIVNALKKMFLGQVIYGPVMTVVFFSLQAALQGETAAEIFARLKRDLVPTLINGLLYWPVCDFITFKFLPVRLQPLMSNSFSFLWTIYITYMASLKKATIEEISVD